MNAEALALVAGNDRLGFSALEERIALASGRLGALGVAAGSRVGLWAENGAEWVAIAHAAARRGALLVPLNTRLVDAEVAWQVERARIALVIASDALAARRPGAARFVAFDEWRRIRPAAAADATGDPGRDQTLVFTSGTTGRPKGALLTRGNHFASAQAVNAALAFGPGDRWLASLPFFHVGGLAILHRAALAGAAVVLPESFSAEDLDRAIEAEAVTHASFVAATLERVLALRGGRPLPASLRAAVVGGGPVPSALLERCPQALASYGLTEAGSMVAVASPGGPAAARAVGRALPGVGIRIAGDGTIEVGGPIVMRGYLDDPGATAAALHGRWLRTGDLGEIDAVGGLRVLARRDDLIVSGGENVYPAEVEQALREHPAVADAAVVGVPDARWGEVPLAFVVFRGGEAADLEGFLAARLARYKRPRIEPCAAIPRLASGKPDRVALRRRVAGAG